MDKHSPDTYYVNNPNRWFTTTGAHKGKTMRSVDILPDGNRNNTSVEYYGAQDVMMGMVVVQDMFHKNTKNQIK